MAAGRSLVRVAFVAGTMAVAFAFAPGALAHTGGSNCTGKLEKRGPIWESECVFPFQGFPIGVAGVYLADDPLKESTLGAEVHVEVLAQLANGTTRPLGVECLQDTIGAARCVGEYNPLPSSLTVPEPVPDEIVGLLCRGHSHSLSPSAATPSGAFACWSTDEAREDLVADHWFSLNGFGPEGS